MNGEFASKQNHLKSKIDQTAATVEEIKNTPKAVVGFRATCAKNFPDSATIEKTENPGNNFFITSSQNIVNSIKTKNNIQLFGEMSNTISVLLTMHQTENLHVRMTEFILFMRLRRYMVKIWALLKFM